MTVKNITEKIQIDKNLLRNLRKDHRKEIYRVLQKGETYQPLLKGQRKLKRNLLRIRGQTKEDFKDNKEELRLLLRKEKIELLRDLQRQCWTTKKDIKITTLSTKTLENHKPTQ
jgi:hypothetical protein